VHELRTQALEEAMRILSAFSEPFLPFPPPATSPSGRNGKFHGDLYSCTCIAYRRRGQTWADHVFMWNAATSPEPLRAGAEAHSVFSFVSSTLEASSYTGFSSLFGKRLQKLKARCVSASC
jgi:hypothetical protein